MKKAQSWRVVLGAGGGLLLSLAGSVGAAPNEQFIPFPNFRVGPLAGIGLGVTGGQLDYMTMINERDGGINGVKITWEECEFEYKVDRGLECYERLKRKGPTGASLINPLNTGVTYALTERTVVDKIPMITMGQARSDTADGRVFPYIFPLITSYWSGDTTMIRFIGQREGGMDKLKGKKIAFVYHGSPFGRESLPIFDTLSKKHGFELIPIEVAPPGTEQQAQWLQIRQHKPDWVIMRTLGVMTPGALKAAQKVGYPADRIVGMWWATAEDEVGAAGEAARGYIGNNFIPVGSSYPVLQELIKRYYSGGKKGYLDDVKRVGGVSYNAGVVQAILNLEGIRVAQRKYGKRPLTGEQVRWGLENIVMDDKRIKQLGAVGLIQPMKTSCFDHEGGGATKYQQWDGGKWVVISDWIQPDRALVRKLVEESAAKYAKEKNITPRDCSKES